MIFERKKKIVPKIPFTFGKRKSLYSEKVEEYGEPAYESRDGEPQITGYGVAVFPDGSAFVKDAKTGEVVKRTESIRYIGQSKGLHFYLSEGQELLIGDQAKPSFPRTDKED